MFKLIPAPNGWLCPDDPGEPERNAPRWSVHQLEAQIISELFKGYRVLEIGTGLGVSTREIAKRAKWVYTIDIDPWVKKVVTPTLPPNVSFFDNIENLPVTNLDAAFIDGNHTYKQCAQDIKDVRKLVRKDGLILFHDFNMEEVRNAAKDSGLPVIYIETPVGMALAWNK